MHLSPQIDHVVINVTAGLDGAADRYRRLGFHLTERGHHTLGTSNHLAIFGTDYLELLGFERGNEGRRPDLVRYPPGLSGLVFKPPSDPGFADALRQMGIPADPAQEFSRPVDTETGPQDARFRTVNVPGAMQNARLFFCHHYTPELVWRDADRRHPNACTGIAGVTIAAADPAETAATFGRIFGAAALTPTDGGLILTATGAEIAILTPSAVTARYGTELLGALAGPLDGKDRMVALDLRTASLDAARAALGAEAVDANGRLSVPASDACGVVLSFRS